MKLLSIINTPAQAHTWKNILKEFRFNGSVIKVIARDYGSTPKILEESGFQCDVFKPFGARSSRLFGVLGHLQKCYRLSQGFEPTMVTGFGLDAAITATRLGTPCIVFIDDEPTHFQNSVTGLLASAVISPDNFKQGLGEKHVLVNSYKELAYLHPKYFEPDVTIFDELGIEKGEKYSIVRINVWDAVHDIGERGFSVSDQFELVKELEKYSRVFISPEGALPEELEKYRLVIPYNRIHHALHYAQLLVTDTQTMATEAAILGTPAVRSNSFVGPNDMSNFIELEQRYDLIYSLREPGQAIRKAMELIKKADLKEVWAQKRLRLLEEKIDLTRFMVDFIQNFPESLREYQETGLNYQQIGVKS